MSRRHLTASGRFEVRRDQYKDLFLYHVPSGLDCGGFSHLTIRTFKAALQGVERAEALLRDGDLALIDGIRERVEIDSPTRMAQKALIAALEASFPNGQWARR